MASLNGVSRESATAEFPLLECGALSAVVAVMGPFSGFGSCHGTLNQSTTLASQQKRHDSQRQQ